MLRTALIVAVAVLLCATAVLSVPPRTLSMQGVLRDDLGNVVPDGAHLIRFSIYDQDAGGSPLWFAERMVSTVGGIYDVILGEFTPLDLDFDGPYWLGLEVEGEGELTPRYELTAAPYAFRAIVADSLVGGAPADADWIMSGDNMYSGAIGNVGVGTTTPEEKLHVRDETVGGVSYAVKLDNPSGSAGTATGVLFKVDGGTETRGKGGLVYERTGTWNRGSFHFLQDSGVTYANPDLADAVMTIDNGGNVGIGTTTPSELLQVAGTVHSTLGGFRFPDGSLQTSSAGGGLVLPYAGSATTAGDVFDIENDGTGQAVVGTHTASGNYGYLGGAVYGVPNV